MKRVYGGKVLLMKAKVKAKRQDQRRVKRLVNRQAKRLVGKPVAASATVSENSQPETSNQK